LAVNREEFLVEDYKLRIDYLNAHFGRMWTRFNFFLTLESGLIGFFFVGDSDAMSENTPLFLTAQIVLSLIWWVFGAQDRWLVEAYRDDIDVTKDRIVAAGLAEGDYKAVGDYTEPDSASKLKNPVQWYSTRMSITRLAGYVPLLLMFAWLSMSAWYTSAARNDVVWTYAALIGALFALILIVVSFIASGSQEKRDGDKGNEHA
jgi:hypothetical protein